MSLCIEWYVSVVYIYCFVGIGNRGLMVGIYGWRGCMFCRLVCGGIRGGLYPAVRMYVRVWSGRVGFAPLMCSCGLLDVVVSHVYLSVYVVVVVCVGR